jgi:two-component system chemotaxis sensor kinase CheA
VTYPPDERGSELLDLFFETSQELLQALNEGALRLEKTPGDEEIVRSIRRTVHTLKGDSAACGLRELSELAHQFEDALSLEGSAGLAEVAAIAFESADLFVEMIAAYRSGGALPSTAQLSGKIQSLTAQSEQAAGGSKKTKDDKASTVSSGRSGAVWTEQETQAMAQAQASGQDVMLVFVRIDAHCAMPIAARQLIHNAVAAMGQIIAVQPDAKSPAAAKHVEFVLASAHSAEQVAAKCKIPTIVQDATAEVLLPANAEHSADSSECTPSEAPAENAPAIPAASEMPSTPSTSAAVPAVTVTPENVLRVEAGRIDNVLNLVGELIIGKSMLQQALNEFSKHYPKELLRGKFADAMAFQSRVLNDLQRSVMKIRMVPADQLFRRFPRMVRDVARQCEREVNLAISGHDTDLDKGILDAIAEPLTHLVRNAIGHGI